MKEILFVIVQVIANTMQALTGFAGGPISMPPSMALVGVENAKASVTMTLWIVATIVTIQNIKHVNVKKLLIMLSLMIVGMLPGMWLFNTLPVKLLMIIFGVVVVLIGVVKFLGLDKGELKPPFNYLALIVSGLMQGMFTSGGPFLVLYATSAMPDKKEFRATVSPIWSILNIYLMYNMYTKGMYTPYSMKLVGMAILPILGGILVGNKINHKVDQKTFLKIVYVLLIISGGTLLINAFS